MRNNKMFMIALVAVFAVLAGAFIVAEHTSDSSEAATTISGTVGVPLMIDLGSKGYTGGGLTSGSVLPPGLSLQKATSSDPWYLVGTPTTAGAYSFAVQFTKPLASANTTSYYMSITNPAPISYLVTYNSTLGLINGSSTYSESVLEGGHPNPPTPTYSDGSQSFVGWGLTQTATTYITSSYQVTGPITLYAIWKQNATSATNTNWAPTISPSCNDKVTFVTTPSTATISKVSGSSWFSLSGKTLMISIPSDAAAGSYSSTFSVSASGWSTVSFTITAKVPVYVNPPIQYTQDVGSTFSYKPETNPVNATITLTKATFNGANTTGFSVVNGFMTGVLSTANGEGTYVLTGSASAGSYASSTFTVTVYARTPDPSAPAPTISGISYNERAGQPRTFDFIANGLANASNISWTYNGQVFMTASDTSLLTFPTAGSYTVRCTVSNGAGSAYKEISVVCKESYYPELAWAGVQYGFYVSSGSADVSGVSWLSVSGSMISGTPTTSDIGQTFTFIAGGVTQPVKVYAAETVAPVSDFTVELTSIGSSGTVTDGSMLATVTFIGSNASVVYYDYGDGSPLTTDTTHVYPYAGFYPITGIAVNNISARSSMQNVVTGGADEPVPVITPETLTDITVVKGETIKVLIEFVDGDVPTLNGTAAKFLSIQTLTLADGSKQTAIMGNTTDVDVGTYDLGLIVTHANGTQSAGHCNVTIKSAGEDEHIDIPWKYIIIAIVILIIIGVAVHYAGGKDKKGHKKW